MAESAVIISTREEGSEQVVEGFQRIGSASEQMSNRVSTSSATMDTSWKRLALTSAGLIANSVQLGDIMDRMAKGQMDLGRGALMLAMNFLQLATQIWVIVGAEHARAIAHGIANALAGPAGWAILAGAAAAAAIGIGLATQIPKAAEGGITTGPTVALIGEQEQEAIIPLSRLNNFFNNRSLSVGQIVIQEARTPRETSEAVLDALRRSGVA